MSNKKYRPHAAKAKQKGSQDAWTESQTKTGDLPEDVKDPEHYMKAVEKALMNMPCHGERRDDPMTEDEARKILENGVRFLDGLVKSVQTVMQTVPVGALRKICGGDIPSVGGAAFPSEPEPDEPRKRPRGRSHPVGGIVAAKPAAQTPPRAQPPVDEADQHGVAG